MKVAIVLGSTRPGRRAGAVGDWVRQGAAKHGGDHGGGQFEIVDLADHELPLLDEPVPAAVGGGEYLQPHTRAWSARVSAFDAFVFVVPEYNRSVPAALKNALDYLYPEWADKAAGIVSYGVDAGGARAAEHLRQVLTELRVAHVRDTVPLSMFTDFDGDRFVPAEHREDALHRMLDELLRWAGPLRTLRESA
jgi:NAD(P)H-dependent FMN reductase